MTTKFERGSVVTDNTLQFMKPAVEGNAEVEFSSVGYLYYQYIENDGYACNEKAWLPLYIKNRIFRSDKDAIEYLNYLREEYPNRKFNLIITKRLDTHEVIE